MNTKRSLFIERSILNFVLIIVLLFGQVGQVLATPAILHVKADATGVNNGTSWADAYTDLQSAISAATNGGQIWVAAGTYYPTSGPDRTATFTLQNDLAIYGGFTGTETLLVERDPSVNVTILSGDIGILGDTSDNSYHVITGGGTNNTAVLDGFTVTAGNANGTTNPNFRGGGMYNNNSSPSLRNMAFSGNSASNSGGGMYNNSSNPVLTNVIFSGNTSAREGGGMGNENSGPSLTNVAFITNTASNYGGGMFNAGSAIPILMNVTFRGNTATIFGGGMYNLVNNASLTNVTFSENTATEGGGMFNDDSSPSLTNVTFSGNTATGNAGGAIWNYSGDSDPIIKNSIFWGNSTEFDTADGNPVISDSIVAGGCPAGGVCTNVIDADPLLDTLADNGGFTQTMSLGAGSPAIDAGENASCATTDQRGVARPQGPHCDIGAYESPDTTIPVVLSIVRANLDPTNAPIVNFTVTFSEPVMGVNLSTAFALTTTGVTGAYLSNISGSGATYTVSVGTGSGSGTIRLDVVDYDSIVDTSSNPLGGVGAGNGNFTSGESYTILTQSGPTFTVNTAADSNGTCDVAPGDCSLREAINAANALAGTDTITFDADYTITLSGSQLPVITSTMIITGNGEADTIVQANAAPNTATYRVLEISGAGNLTLNDMTVRNGNCNGSCANIGSVAGGILNRGVLTLNNITVSGNSASTFAAGIYNTSGTLTLNASTVSNNSAGSEGGGIINLGGTATLNNSTVSGNSATNSGGGIYNNGGSLTVQNGSLIGGPMSANTAQFGGGLFNNGTTTIDASTVSGNSAQYGGGIFTNETLNIQNGSTIGGAGTGNSAAQNGGGIYINHFYTGTTTIDASTIFGNTATLGGGIYNSVGNLTLTDVTFSGNEARATGGGIYNLGTMTLNYSTVANNTSDSDNNSSGSGGGIFNGVGIFNPAVNLKSSIVAGNQNGTSGTTHATADCSGAITSQGYNVTGNGTGCSFISTSDVRVTPANIFTTVLGTLADNSGPTQTHALLPGSPAIDRIPYGTNGCGAPFNLDQRGITRPQGTHCDIGAFELGDTTPPIVSTIVLANIYPSNATSVNFTVTFSEFVNGVDASDFALATTGITGAFITAVTGSNAMYTVSVDTGSGLGTIRLDVIDDDSILNAASLPLGGINAGNGNFTSGESYSNFIPQSGPTFTVTTAADANDTCDTAPGDCSLREAIKAANALSGMDTIIFNADYTITLVGSQLPVITSTVIITGNGVANTIVQADANPNTASYRVLEIGETGNLTLNNMTVRNGNCNGACSNSSFANVGGGILNRYNGRLTLDHVVVTGNSAHSGGGVYNFINAELNVIGTTFYDNSAGHGGGIYNTSSGLIANISDSVFSSNSADFAGSIQNQGTITIINNSIFTDNSANFFGGAIFNNFGVITSLSNSTISNNSAGTNGGGLHNQGTITAISNSTISDNSAGHDGGGIYNDGTAALTNNTLSGNSAATGGGIYNNSGTLNYVNTIIANSPSGGDCHNGGTIGTNINNLIEDGSCSPAFSGDPVLGALADNGGFTQTMALLPGSPAINAGNNANCSATDQRGVSRVGTCDIGAYEFEYTPFTGIGYVKWDATGANDGSSWADAYTDLQSALVAASPGAEIWVAKGTYYPTSGTNRFLSFNLKNGVAIYGGFDGTETLRTERDSSANITTLSGDLLANDNTNIDRSEPTRSDNSYHVVTGSGTNNTAILDGFTITAGNAFGNYPHNLGAGMYSNSGSPTLTNLTFKHNTAVGGAGLQNFNGSSPTLNNIIFEANSAPDGAGGGLANQYFSNPTLTNVIFDGNIGGTGGGLYNNSSSPVLTNVTFTSNLANFGIGAGIFNTSSDPMLINVTFDGNTATYDGGGMYNFNSTSTLVNVTLSRNSASVGDGIYNQNSNVNITNSILWGNNGNNISNDATSTTTITYSIIEGGYAGIGNLSSDPMLGVLAENGGFTQTMALLPGSPAIDAGNNAACPATDQRGEPRPFPVNGNCDIGAYESQFVNSAPVITEGASINVTMSEDGSPIAFALTLNATDTDGHTLTWSISAIASNGTAIASGTGLSQIIGYSPSADYNGSDSFEVQVSDGNGGLDTITVSVTVDPINDAPSYTAINPPTILEDAGAQTVTGWASFSPGPVNESGQTVNSYVVSSVGNPGLFSTLPTIATNGTLSYRTANNANGTSTFTVRVQDSGGTANGGSDSSTPQTFTLTVTAVNDNPSITQGADQTVNEDAGPQTVVGWATNISAGPPDESWQTVTLSIVGYSGPFPSALFTVQPRVDATTGDLTYTPAPNAYGSVTIAVIPSDSGGPPIGPMYPFVITIAPVNDPPVITEGDSVNVTMSEDGDPTAFDLTLNATDVEGNTLTWSISSPSSHGTASASGTGTSKSIVYNPSPDYYGTDSFEVRVSDGNLADHITVNVTIDPVNDAPIITEGASIDVTMSQNGTPTAFASTLHATDPDGNTLTWSVSAPATHGTAIASGTGLTKIIDYTPQTNYNGTDSFTVQVSDGNGGTDTITVNVTITPVNAVPTLDAIDPASARVDDPDLDLDINGANFTSNAIVKWRNITTNTTTNLVTTYVSSTELSTVVPSALLVNTGTFEISVFNPAPGGGTSISLPFFVTQTAASIISSDTATSTNPVGTAVASTGGSGAGTPGSITATGTGIGTITVTIYDSNPRSASPFRVSGKYFDVYVAQGSNFSSVQIVACNMTAFSSVKWLDSNNKWKVVNPQSYSNGCVTMNLSNTSSPKISQLTGTIFGVEESPVKNIVLIDSLGGGLAGATAQYYVNGWHNIPGTTDTDGILSYEGLGLSGNITFRITYANTSIQKQQNVTNNPEVTFQTQLVSMQLLASNGTTELNGDAQYYSNGWLTFGNGFTTTSMELLPLNYTFRVSYGGASVQKQQNIGNDPAVIFQTKSVSMQLLASNGTTELAGTSEYYANGWKTFGGGSTSTTMELLPVNYTFRISYGGASIQKQQDVNTNAAVVFQTKLASMQLLASNGTTELSGTSEYYASGWKTFGNGSTTTTMELLPVNYTFRVSYGGASVQKQQDVNANPLVVFQTKLVTMKLLASNGTTELVGTTEYYGNGWKTFGNGTTTTTMELLPVNYTFRVSYGGASVQKQQDVNANQLVVFQTGQVRSNSSSATQYYANGWKAFVQNIELLPGSYPFKFNDGTLQTTYALIAGAINNIH